MTYKEFQVVAAKKHSAELANLLKSVGIRFEQSTVYRPGMSSLYLIAVHSDDFDRASEVQDEALKREREALVRTLQFTRQPLSGRDMLIARKPNEAGYYVSWAYRGEPYDSTQYRVVRKGWDHEHCYLCAAKVLPGQEWWTAPAPKHVDEVGLCLDCYARLFG